jgi:hypothetical protein
MLLRFIPETWVENIRIILILFNLLCVLIWNTVSKILIKKKDKNFQIINESIVFTPGLIMLIWIIFFLSSSWRQIPELNKRNFFFDVGTLILFGFLFYHGIKTALIFKKTKQISYIIWGVLSSSLSLFGFALSLFKVLQMFNIVVWTT